MRVQIDKKITKESKMFV